MQSRILPLLGPAVVLYLVADLAAELGGLSPLALGLAAAAALSGFAPVLLRAKDEVRGASRVAFLGVSAGATLLIGVAPPGASVSADVLVALAAALTGVVVLDLAWVTPEPSPFGARTIWFRVGAFALAFLSGLAGILAPLPVFEVANSPVLVPAWWRVLPLGFALFALAAALGIRLWRRVLGPGPEALASNAWALIGLWPATMLGLAAAVLGVSSAATMLASALLALATLALTGGHIALVDKRRRMHAGEAGRRALAGGLVAGMLAGAVAGLGPLLPREPSVFALATFVALASAIVLYRLIRPTIRRAIAPFGGRLLDAVAAASDRLPFASRLEDLGPAVLGPFRETSRVKDAQAVLLTLEPGYELRIDAASLPRVRSKAMPESLVRCLLDRPGEILVRAALEEHVVRRPELRPVVEVLNAYDALCAIPIAVGGDLEGALIVPKGDRRAPLRLEELSALEALGARLAGPVAALTAIARLQLRAGELSVRADRSEERIEALEEEIARLRAEGRVLRSGRSAARIWGPAIAYGKAMRALERRLEALAPLDVPIMLRAEIGTPIEQVGRRLHELGGRADGPYVVADCASVRPEESEAALFGNDGPELHAGFLRLARGGTLLLADVPALSLEAQRELAEALAAKQATAVGGGTVYPVDARVIATSRVPLATLVEAGVFDPELARWLGNVELEVPPLRQRREDIPSLVLLALDRACRVLGRPALGIEPAALEVLLGHDWPGNLRELQYVIDRAVRRAMLPQVRRRDLPPLVRSDARPASEDLLAGTYVELERRILWHAMVRAAGNKSEAARTLGLKRTTFLDKLRKHKLEDWEEVSRRENAA